MGDRLEEDYYQDIFGPCALEMEVKLIIEWLTFFLFIQSAGNLIPLAGRQKSDTECGGILSYFIIIFP